MRTHTNASAYAWSLLAEHLRLPENAMGMMVEATENDQRGWQAARREAEHMLVPQKVSHPDPSYTVVVVLVSQRTAPHPQPTQLLYHTISSPRSSCALHIHINTACRRSRLQPGVPHCSR